MPLTPQPLRLAVIPSDPISAYEAAGYEGLESYYNPAGLFREVYALSPLEPEDREAHGMHIVRVTADTACTWLKKIRPDVIRAYGGYWPADFACRHRLWNVPVIVSVHDKRPEMVHASVRYADLVICVSEAVAEEVLRKGADPARIRMLPNRIDLSVFRPRAGTATMSALDRRFPQGKSILHVGRKSPEKNLDTLLKALVLLPREYYVIAVGRGDAAPYARLAAKLGVADRYFGVGSVTNSELAEWYAWCSCMCTPSLSEGFGTVFIEAAACGAAIVTSDLAPMNRYLRHGESACLVKRYDDPESIALAVRHVCEDREYRDSISAGAVKAATPFDAASLSTREADIYRESLGLKLPGISRRLATCLWRLTTKMESL